MFYGRPLVDCIEKDGENFGAGKGSWLGCYRELIPHFERFYTLDKKYYVMARTTLVWAPTNCVQ
jgi:hypothetical protein